MNGKGRKPVEKREVAIAMAVSGMELALYMIIPIFAGYFVGREFGTIGTVAGLFLGAIIGLALAVRRAIRMSL